MADSDCCNNFGGRISIAINGEQWTPSDADVTIDPTNLSVEAKANIDGSPAYMGKPKLYKADIKFRNGCGMKWDNIMRRCSIDVTIAEEDNDRTHIFTSARITGEPKLNLSTGEIDGLAIEGARYQALNG